MKRLQSDLVEADRLHDIISRQTKQEEQQKSGLLPCASKLPPC